jgi:hypothetical protein
MQNVNEENKPQQLHLNYQKRKSEPFLKTFEVGNLNYETPLSYFLKTYYKNSTSSYIYHKEIVTDNLQKNFIFILKNDILLTTAFEDEKNTSQFNYITTNPILLKVDYKSVCLF